MRESTCKPEVCGEVRSKRSIVGESVRIFGFAFLAAIVMSGFAFSDSAIFSDDFDYSSVQEMTEAGWRVFGDTGGVYFQDSAVGTTFPGKNGPTIKRSINLPPDFVVELKVRSPSNSRISFGLSLIGVQDTVWIDDNPKEGWLYLGIGGNWPGNKVYKGSDKLTDLRDFQIFKIEVHEGNIKVYKNDVLIGSSYLSTWAQGGEFIFSSPTFWNTHQEYEYIKIYRQIRQISSTSSTSTATYTINFYASNGGTITFDGKTYSDGDSDSYAEGIYRAKANPSSGYGFSAWATSGGLSVSDRYSETTQITISGDGNLAASFQPVVKFRTNPPSIGTIAVSGTGKGTGTYKNEESALMEQDCTNCYTITAISPSNYVFIGWDVSGSLSLSDSTSKSTSLIVRGPGTITANFAQQIPSPSERISDLPALAIHGGKDTWLLSVDRQIVEVEPGDTFSINVEYQIWSTPGTIRQAYFIASWTPSWPPPSGYYFPVYDGIPGDYPGVTGTKTLTIQAPSEPGEYVLWFVGHAHYSLEQAIATETNEKKDAILASKGHILVRVKEPTPPIQENQPPSAFIDSITPNPADQGETIHFSGYGSDPDGTIVAYNWRSSIDGFLSSSKSFSTSTLSAGEHIIYFKVKDDSGEWSEDATMKLVVNQPERKYLNIQVMTKSGKTSFKVGDAIEFVGEVTDDKGSPVSGVQVKMYNPIDGRYKYTSTSSSGNFEFSANASRGGYWTFTFKACKSGYECDSAEYRISTKRMYLIDLYIYNAATSKPVDGVKVWVDDSLKSTTNNYGRPEPDIYLPRGRYLVRISKSGCKSVSFSVAIPMKNMKEIPLNCKYEEKPKEPVKVNFEYMAVIAESRANMYRFMAEIVKPYTNYKRVEDMVKFFFETGNKLLFESFDLIGRMFIPMYIPPEDLPQEILVERFQDIVLEMLQVKYPNLEVANSVANSITGVYDTLVAMDKFEEYMKRKGEEYIRSQQQEFCPGNGDWVYLKLLDMEKLAREEARYWRAGDLEGLKKVLSEENEKLYGRYGRGISEYMDDLHTCAKKSDPYTSASDFIREFILNKEKQYIKSSLEFVKEAKEKVYSGEWIIEKVEKQTQVATAAEKVPAAETTTPGETLKPEQSIEKETKKERKTEESQIQPIFDAISEFIKRILKFVLGW